MPETPDAKPTAKGGLSKKWHGMPVYVWISGGVLILAVGYYLYERNKASSAAAATGQATGNPVPITGTPTTPTPTTPTKRAKRGIRQTQVGGGYLSETPVDGFQWIETSQELKQLMAAGEQVYYEPNPGQFMPFYPASSPLAKNNPIAGTPLYAPPNALINMLQHQTSTTTTPTTGGGGTGTGTGTGTTGTGSTNINPTGTGNTNTNPNAKYSLQGSGPIPNSSYSVPPGYAWVVNHGLSVSQLQHTAIPLYAMTGSGTPVKWNGVTKIPGAWKNNQGETILFANAGGGS